MSMMSVLEKHLYDGGWTPIATLPERDASYLVFCRSADPRSPLTTTAWFQPGVGWSALPQCWVEAITHWMELPKPPIR